MSTAAMNWAMEQRTGSPSAQCVLYVIADVAKPDGIAFCGIRYIAERSQQSPDTVRRRLRELEEAGYLVRFARHMPNGRRTSDELRLQMGRQAVPVDDPESPEKEGGKEAESAAEPARKEPEGPSQIARGDPGRLQGYAPGKLQGGTPAQVQGGPSQSCKGKDPFSEPIPPSKLPPGGSPFGGGTGQEPQDPETAEGLQAFKEAYPIPSTRPGEVERLFAALSEPERKRATEGAQGYAVFLQRNRARKPMDARKFLREPALWAEFAPLAPKPEPPRVFVAEGSRKWAAMSVYHAVLNGKEGYRLITTVHQGRRGTWVKGTADFDAIDALADFADETGQPDFGNWKIVEEGTRQWWAWTERVRRWCGQRLEAELIEVPGETEQVARDGETITVPKRVRGRLLPGEWPPRAARPAAGAGTEDGHA